MLTLTQLQDQAKTCVKNTTNEIDKIDEQAKKIVNNNITGDVRQEYLKKKKNELIKRQSSCQLFLLRSTDTISAFSSIEHQRTQLALFNREPHLLERIVKGFRHLPEIGAEFDGYTFYKNTGIQSFDVLGLVLLGLVIIIAITVGIGFQKWLRSFIRESKQLTFGQQATQAFISTLSHYSVWLLPLLTASLYLAIFNRDFELTPFINLTSYALLVYVIVLMLIRLFFYPHPPISPLIKVPSNLSRSFTRRLITLATLLLVGHIIYSLLRQQPLSEDILHLLRTIYITLVAINLISIIWLINKIPQLKDYPLWRYFLSVLLSATFFATIGAEWVGYHRLALFFLLGIFLTLIYSIAAWFIFKILNSLIDLLVDETHHWQKRLHYYLGLSPHKGLSELMALRFVTFVIVWSGYFLLLLHAWGLHLHDIKTLVNGFFHGFTVEKFSFVPARILIALLVFTFLALITRWLRAYFYRHPQVYMDESAKIAFSSIFGYVAFTVSLLFALIIAGVNFTGLAIIAGALSVGIGFWLQNIVSDFISGLILLTERPIKPGDRIIVGNTEGFVKKVRIRSTQITTMERSDVIIPNSDLTREQVVNYMFRDQLWRLRVDVGVAYESDVELVEKLLYTAAGEHPQVIQEGPNAPLVLFKGFGDSSLAFSLLCVIPNVNLKYIVQSNLYFAVERKFRENNITIPFPQRDIHIK
ncbi:mechanosensitive ion channel family protein [Coxiella burnetii]|uniref:mechanosensitive ion channel family protein n=1 Tax=Coxiella burnetii TaxID=777 RepID=UPI0021AFBC4D|nr:mechanosensitive ion channel domain-containing protein [Coxiella burnetii]